MAAAKPIPELKHLARVLVSERAIRQKVALLGEKLNRDYRGKDLTVVAIVNGALIFTADLLRRLRSPLRLDCVRASSYHSDTKSQGWPEVIDNLKLDITGHHVLLVDDILDTGKTLSAVRQMLLAKGALSVRTCVLLDKKARRVVPFEAEYVGFEIPNEFVVGYGLDFAERYRNLPCIGVLKPKFYAGKI
ncbi:MAG TPA: hypoxanthine phosphoribosyltransferase [Candidatus Didemnitutus sp.]|nr:hypoxanthine phosphoribosyltransferase [Candidatus Didemnitutus sp.]